MKPPARPRKARGYPPRQPRNGHSPDCPYAHDRPADQCGICRSEAIAAEARAALRPGAAA